MVLSHRFKYVYSVIPKTGSTTLRYAFQPFTDLGFPNEHFTNHVPLHLAANTEYFKYYKEYFSFSFVRNPYDRIYSGFLQDIWASKTIEKWKNAKEKIFKLTNYNFSEYLSKFISTADIMNDWSYICYCPMWAFTEYEDYNVNFIGQLENFEKDIHQLSILLNIELHITKSHNIRNQNKANSSHIAHYTKREIDIVNNLYKEDFKKFGYKMM